MANSTSHQFVSKHASSKRPQLKVTHQSWSTQNSMVLNCVHWTLKFQQTKALNISLHGQMLPWWPKRKQMGAFMSMTWRVTILKNRNSWFNAIKVKIFKWSQVKLAMQFWSGLRISTIPLEKATTASIIFSTCRSLVVEIGNLCLCSRIFSKTWLGYPTVSNSSSFQATSPPLLLYTTKTASHFLNLVSVIVTPSASVHFLS